MINVGLIGCGRIADLHALGYRNNPDARIYAVCDAVADRAEQRRIEWGVDKAYTDYRALLADPAVDAVEVLTPYDTHEPVVIDAAAAGKHIACQKPMTTSLASADRMVNAARAAGVVYKVTEIFVTYPPLVMAKQMIDEGLIGEPAGMRIKYVASTRGGWHVPPSTYEQQMRIASTGLGFETFDHGHHEWAVAWWLLGEVDRVSAWIDSINGVVDDPAVIMWKHRNSKRYGVCDFLWTADMPIPGAYYANDEWFEITGSKGILFVNHGTGELSDRAPVSLCTGDAWQHFDDVPADWSEGFTGSTRDFIAAIQGRKTPLLTGEQGREVLRFGLAVTASAARRREVYLDELDHPFPRWLAWNRRRQERKEAIVGPRRKGLLARLERDTSQYAPQAKPLTLALAKQFNAAKAGEWTCAIALHLLADGGLPNQSFGIYVDKGQLTLRENDLPEKAVLTLRMPAGIWAAILLGKKRMETAVFQGKIKYEGDAAQGLRLKSALGL